MIRDEGVANGTPVDDFQQLDQELFATRDVGVHPVHDEPQDELLWQRPSLLHQKELEEICFELLHSYSRIVSKFEVVFR